LDRNGFGVSRAYHASVRFPFKSLILLAFVALFAYAGVTAYVGFRVGRGIAQAKASNPFMRMGASLLGRDSVEQIVIKRVGVSRAIVASPAFWIALRLTE